MNEQQKNNLTPRLIAKSLMGREYTVTGDQGIKDQTFCKENFNKNLVCYIIIMFLQKLVKTYVSDQNVQHSTIQYELNFSNV